MKVIKLSDIEHIRLRPGMYIGSLSPVTSERWLYKDSNLTSLQVQYRPGLLKIIDEIIDNALDVILKTGIGDTIKVEINDTIRVSDNSSGFLSGDDYSQLDQIILAFSNARAGSNFNDEQNVGQIGMNGVGSFVTNCFSKFFNVISSNASECSQVKFENCNVVSKRTMKKRPKTGTEIEFCPDYNRWFESTPLTNTEIDLVQTRLGLLSITYPEIKFIFNKKIIKPKSILSCDVLVKNEDITIGISANLENKPDLSVINGIENVECGTNISYIYKLARSLFSKYNASVVNNAIQVFFIGSKFKNPKFSSQAKTKLTNSEADIRKYIGDLENQIIKKLKNNAKIKDLLQSKSKFDENYKNNKELDRIKKQKIRSKKFIDAPNSNTLIIVEGESALGGLIPAVGRDRTAYYMLRGKPLNVFDISQSKAMGNLEISELINIISRNNFERIVIATDQDLDGFHIRGLMLGFIHKYLPEFERKLYFMQTPLMGVFVKDKLVKWYYDIREGMNDTGVRGDVRYFKGLGSWDKDDLKHVIKTDGLAKMLLKIEYNNYEILSEWLGNDSSARKNKIAQHEFSLASV